MTTLSDVTIDGPQCNQIGQFLKFRVNKCYLKIAQTSGKVQIVSDPNYVRIFNADGTITELPK